jgi:hypothetical protein
VAAVQTRLLAAPAAASVVVEEPLQNQKENRRTNSRVVAVATAPATALKTAATLIGVVAAVAQVLTAPPLEEMEAPVSSAALVAWVASPLK